MSTTTLRFEFAVDGTLTDATTVLLSDPTGTFGVRRTDTNAVVVADGTAMTRSSAGVYSYEFTDPAARLTYNYWVEVVYDGATYRFEKNRSQSDGVVTAQEMVDKIKAALRNNPVGMISIMVDGQQVTYDRKSALDELRFWQREAAKEDSTRPRVSSVKFGGIY